MTNLLQWFGADTTFSERYETAWELTSDFREMRDEGTITDSTYVYMEVGGVVLSGTAASIGQVLAH